MRPVPPAPDPTLWAWHNQCYSISRAVALCNQVGDVFVHFPSLSGPEGRQTKEPSRQTKEISSSPPDLPQGCWVPG